MSVNKPVQLGLCCINMTLRGQNPPIYCSRRMIIRKIKQMGIIALKMRILQNLKDLSSLIKWNEQNGIKVLRISSELFPHFSNPKVESYDMDFADKILKNIGKLAKN